jgi:hypothetical protein
MKCKQIWDSYVVSFIQKFTDLEDGITKCSNSSKVLGEVYAAAITLPVV